MVKNDVCFWIDPVRCAIHNKAFGVETRKDAQGLFSVDSLVTLVLLHISVQIFQKTAYQHIFSIV
jgi:hypothetical protein